MRYRLMATYDGSPFEAGIGPTENDIVLFAACPPPEELGFEPATGHWRKAVRVTEVQAVWESKPVGVFRGERCLVLDDLGDRLHIGYLGHDGFKAGQLGYWQVDRGVFELIAPRTEVTDILEERVDVPRPASRAAAGDPRPATAPASAPADDYQWGAEHPSGPIRRPRRAAPSAPLPPAVTAPASVPAPDGRTGVALPTPPETPLPLEAEAMRAASAARLRDEPEGRSPGVTLRPAEQAPPPAARLSPVATAPPLGPVTAAGAAADPPSRQHRAARRRMDTERLFADLANLAGIPADSYSVGDEVEGALCLVATAGGFEVFLAAGGARHELQTFTTEEAACFYLFGVLAAEAVRTGTLVRVPRTVPGWQPQTA